jgi:hypothetical protein
MLAGKAAELYDAVRTSGLDVGAVARSWADLKTAGGSPFFAASFETKDKMKVEHAGDGGLRGLRDAAVCSPANVLFGAISFFSEGRQRFAFFSWCGAAVGGMAKGRMGLQKGAAAKAIDGCVADLRFEDAAAMEDGAVIAALEKAGNRGVTLSPP